MPTAAEMEAMMPTEAEIAEMKAMVPTEAEIAAMVAAGEIPTKEEQAAICAECGVDAFLVLEGLVGPHSPFRISYRDAAKRLGTNYHGARNMFHLLERRGWLERTHPGRGGSGPTAYRWLV